MRRLLLPTFRLGPNLFPRRVGFRHVHFPFNKLRALSWRRGRETPVSAMLRRAALTLTGGAGAAGAYGYMWANDNLGSDALDRIIQVCALACMCDP
jgi:hypothetical protein